MLHIVRPSLGGSGTSGQAWTLEVRPFGAFCCVLQLTSRGEGGSSGSRPLEPAFYSSCFCATCLVSLKFGFTL